MVKILVGANETVFVIDEKSLAARSKFFNNALKGRWKEAEDKIVRLPDDEASIFAVYKQLVYTGRIPCMEVQKPPIEYRRMPDHCDIPTACCKEYESLCSLYVFADKIQDLRAKSSTTAALVWKINDETGQLENDGNVCFPSAQAISIMYLNTPRNCPGRVVLARAYAFYGHEYTSLPGANEVPRRVLVGCNQRLAGYQAPM